MKDQKGFTLVELAIALVVIGLLLGGILKGQEIIENGKITATVRMLENMQSAVAMFDSAYDALPGDIKDPATRIPDCTTALCNVTGNGNRRVNYIRTSTDRDVPEEQYNFFPHMTKAGFLKYPEGGATAPAADDEEAWAKFVPSLPIDDIKITVYWTLRSWGGTTFSQPPGNYFEVIRFPSNTRKMTGKQVFAIDEKIDDGKPLTGNFVVMGGTCMLGAWSDNTYNPKGECDPLMRGRF